MPASCHRSRPEAHHRKSAYTKHIHAGLPFFSNRATTCHKWSALVHAGKGIPKAAVHTHFGADVFISPLWKTERGGRSLGLFPREPLWSALEAPPVEFRSLTPSWHRRQPHLYPEFQSRRNALREANSEQHVSCKSHEQKGRRQAGITYFDCPTPFIPITGHTSKQRCPTTSLGAGIDRSDGDTTTVSRPMIRNSKRGDHLLCTLYQTGESGVVVSAVRGIKQHDPRPVQHEGFAQLVCNMIR